REHGHALYPPRETPLEDIVTNNSSLTGSNNWLLSSMMLLVFETCSIARGPKMNTLNSTQ
ncbi:unnamed protein product, partial [Ectocarpus sp. 13 AM-2016]